MIITKKLLIFLKVLFFNYVFARKKKKKTNVTRVD